MTVYTLLPPTVEERPAGGGRLFSFYRRTVGVALLVTGATVVQRRHPSTDEIAAADVTYLGGHEYAIDADAAAVLVTAGYGALLHPTPDTYGDTYGDTY